MSIELNVSLAARKTGPEQLRVEVNLQDARVKFRRQLQNVLDLSEHADETPEAAAERSFLVRYLRKNVESAETIASMKELIREFGAHAPVMLVHKCIDGRVHGSKGKGYPPTTVDFLRTEGCKLDTDNTNQIFWEKMDIAVMEAAHNTPGTPALFIDLAHTASEGHGCAAQSAPDLSHEQVVENSLNTVKGHAKKVREHYGDRVFALHGITNTDDMSETLIFENGTELSTADIIAQTGLGNPEEVFAPEFLDSEITDPSIVKHVGSTSFRELINGDFPPIYNDLRSGIAMEVYLMKMISSGNETIVNPAIMERIEEVFENAGNIPDSLHKPLIYQTVWNIAYTMYQRNRLKMMQGEFREKHLEHAEELIGYGEGFELLRRNEAVLAKTGRGDDKKALSVAKRVLDGNRKKSAGAEHPQPHRPIVHINIEVSGDITSWHQFNKQVLVKLKAMSERVREVYGDEPACIMTTYSYDSGKQFYPVQVYPRPLRTEKNSSFFGVNVAAGLKDTDEFAVELKKREITFSEFFATAA
jgi:hypothetical protein